jgi:hypothetical protein
MCQTQNKTPVPVDHSLVLLFGIVFRFLKTKSNALSCILDSFLKRKVRSFLFRKEFRTKKTLKVLRVVDV